MYRIVTVVEESSGLEIGDGESHDGSFIELCAQTGRNGQQFGQIVEYLRLFAPATARSIPRFLLPLLRIPEIVKKKKKKFTSILSSTTLKSTTKEA